MVWGLRWSTVALGRPTLARNTTNPLAELGLWTPSEAYTGTPGPVLNLGPW